MKIWAVWNSWEQTQWKSRKGENPKQQESVTSSTQWWGARRLRSCPLFTVCEHLLLPRALDNYILIFLTLLLEATQPLCAGQHSACPCWCSSLSQRVPGAFLFCQSGHRSALINITGATFRWMPLDIWLAFHFGFKPNKINPQRPGRGKKELREQAKPRWREQVCLFLSWKNCWVHTRQVKGNSNKLILIVVSGNIEVLFHRITILCIYTPLQIHNQVLHSNQNIYIFHFSERKK